MAKKQAAADDVAAVEQPVLNPYLGADEEDDIDQMGYPDEGKETLADSHPPETKAEAEEKAELAARKAEQEEQPDDPEEETEQEDEPEEPAAESEDEPEASAEEDAEDEEADPTADQKVPYDRFKQVNDKAKAAEQRAKELEERIARLEKPAEPEKPAFDFAAKEKEAMAKMLDGDEDGYIAIRSEIRKAERDQYMSEAEKLADTKTNRLQSQMSFEEKAVQLEKEFPAIDEASANFDAEARDEVLDLYTGYVNSGKYSPTEALDMAARKGARIYGWDKPVDPPPVPSKKKTDVKSKVKADGQQPPPVKSRAKGSDEPTISIASMSDEEFDALPSTTKARLRGDIL